MSSLEVVCPVVSKQVSLKRQSCTKYANSPYIKKKILFFEIMLLISPVRVINRVFTVEYFLRNCSPIALKKTIFTIS